MSSIVVKGMQMPSACRICDFNHYYYCAIAKQYCGGSGIHERASFCPLVELPEKHGRLLDENDVIDAIRARLRELQTRKAFIGKHGDIDLFGVFPYIAKIKAVVEAEGEDSRRCP